MDFIKLNTSLIIKHRWLVIFITLFLSIFASYGAVHLKIDGSSESVVGDEFYAKAEHDQIIDDFSESTEFQVIVEIKDTHFIENEEDIFSAKNLDLIRYLTEQSWQLPHVNRVDSIANFQHTKANNDELSVNDLIALDNPLDAQSIAEIKEIALNERTLLGQSISRKANIATINILISIPDDSSRGVVYPEILAATNVLLEEIEPLHPNLNFHLTGTVAMDDAAANYIEQDMVSLMPLMLVVIAIIVWLLIRSLSITIIASLVVILTGTTTMGILGWLDITLDATSSIAGIVVMTLAVADVIHLAVGAVNGMRFEDNRKEAVAYSINLNMTPIFLTSVTTAIGVITFSLSETESLKMLGQAIAIGALIAFLLTVTLMPALLSLFPIPTAKERSVKWSKQLADVVIKHHKVIAIVGVCLSLMVAFNAKNNQLNESPELIFKPHTPERQAIEIMKSEMDGILRFDVAIYSDRDNYVSSPEYLNTIEEFNAWLSQKEGVSHVNSITDTFKRLNRSMHNDQQDWYRIPESQDLAAQYLLIYELSLPYGLDLAHQLNINKSATRIFVTTKELYSAETVQLKRDIQAWIKQNAPDLQVKVGGWGMVMQQLIFEHIFVAFLKGGALAFTLITIVLLIVFRNVKYGLIGASANLLPVAMGYGIWASINGIANMAVVCVAGVCLGVVIDFAVHFLSKYQVARNAQKSPADAVRYAYEKVTLPLFVTTIVLVCGFWLLMLSPMTINSGLGLLTGIIIILAFLYDLLILPALLVWFGKKMPENSQTTD